LHHLGQVTIANRVFAIPTHANQYDLNRKPATLEHGIRQG
jgi:hypothetical protein